MAEADKSNLPEGLRAHQKAMRDASRAAIVEAAADLFCAQGYAAVSVAQLAKAAGVSPATIYKVFGTKEAVFREMVERELERARAPFLDGVPTFETAEDAARFIAERMTHAFTGTRVPALTQIAIAEGAQFPELGNLYRLPDGREPTQALGEMVFALLEAQGLFKAANAEFAVRQFLGMLGQGLFHEPMARGRPIDDLGGYIDSCVRVFCEIYGSNSHDGP